MKTNSKYLCLLAAALLAVCPAIASAVVIPASAPYNTDKTNSYVQDQTNNPMQNLNGILCHISAMAPDQMVNLNTNSGNYIALVDQNVCKPNDGGGQTGSTNTGANYVPAIVNSSRANNTSAMIAKVWLDDKGGGNGGGSAKSIFAYLAATKEPNPPTDPYGLFRLDFCGKAGGICTSIGYIDSTATGLDFFSQDTGNWGLNGGSITQTLAMKLIATSVTAGKGVLEQTYIGTLNNGQANFAFYFAYDDKYFRRSDGTTDVCFDRSLANAAESVWSYGLYDSTTGARIERNSGFPIEYTAGGVTMNGFVGYWGISSPTTIASNTTVNKVTYSNNTSTKTPYTLLQTGGKLIKYTNVAKTLDTLDKIKFQFWPQANSPATGTPIVTMGTGYEVYWDKANATFQISGQQNTTTFNIVPVAPSVALSVANMMTAAPWGINGWSQMLGGSISINGYGANALISGTTVAVTFLQNVVYPSEFSTLGGMKCINNCPTAADINASNTATTAPVSPYLASTTGWTGMAPTTANLYSYTLDATTGNLMDAAATPAAVVSTATTGNNSFGVTSGRLVATADKGLLDTAAGTVRATAGTYIQQDIDALPSYYQWQTGPQNWSQLSILLDASNVPVKFDPPLNVDYVVPTGAQYGTAAGTTITMQYGGFGNLWGIPSNCIDSATNKPCAVTNGAITTAQANQRWTPQFSIPTSLTTPSQVKVSVPQGTVAAGTTYLVKALNKEIRLTQVPLATCTTAGLNVPVTGSVTLPVKGSWIDPTLTSMGAKPTFTTPPAPQVIHGVKMY